jgi:glycosyltransferase involved in cell wall biosynthesis
MSVYNGSLYLREAVESILNQTFRDCEFIILDDGSTDSTWDILADYAQRDQRIVLLRNEKNIGLTKSLNKGLQRVRGKYIARQDGDDVSLPERLATQIAYLRSHADVGLLGTAYYIADCQGRHAGIYRPPQTDTEIRWKMLFHNAFCHTSVVFRRELFEAGDAFYNEDLPYSQDYNLWDQLLKRTRAANLPTPLVAFRMHESSIAVMRSEEQQRIATAIAARQIDTLMPQPPLSEQEVNTLRVWYKTFPKRLNHQDVALCLVLFQILGEFEKQKNLDPDVLRRLRRHWIGRILGALPISRQKELWRSGLLAAMLRQDALSVLLQVPKQAIHRIVLFIQRNG